MAAPGALVGLACGGTVVTMYTVEVAPLAEKSEPGTGPRSAWLGAAVAPGAGAPNVGPRALPGAAAAGAFVNCDVWRWRSASALSRVAPRPPCRALFCPPTERFSC